MNDIFYCYSKKLGHFLLSMNEHYINKGINKNTNTEYLTFRKSTNLDKKIELYKEIKHKFD